MNFVEASVLIGAVGDLGLQKIVQLRKNEQNPNPFGLDSYFSKRAPLTSIMNAAGMMGVYALIYKKLDPSLNTIGILVYSTILDTIYRNYHSVLMPSLKDYYDSLSPIQTIPSAFLPFYAAKLVSKK